MNTQTRREMAEVLAARLGARVRTLAYPDCGNVKLIDQTLREWGLEMASAVELQACTIESCVNGQCAKLRKIAQTIKDANDQ